MRIIKFRGKCTDDGMWRHGDLLHDNGLVWINDDGLHCTVDEKTVGQFTGLHDKNDTPIYEGDVIQSPLGNVVVVEYGYKEHNVRHGRPAVTDCFAAYGWIVRNVKNGITDFLDYEFLKGWVIGNIYDNPEFCNGKNNKFQR